jgi:hypothetical protein
MLAPALSIEPEVAARHGSESAGAYTTPVTGAAIAS